MSKTKTPNAGEWWVSDRGVIAYVVGLGLNGDPAWQQQGSRQILTDQMKFFLACFHHEPRCTGFDWLPVADALAREFCAENPKYCVMCGVVFGAVPVQPDEVSDMAAIITEHTTQLRELTQRIGDLVQQVNERDAVIEGIRTALHVDYSV